MSDLVYNCNKEEKKSRNPVINYIWKNRFIYLLILPVILYYIIFNYLPMYGAILAFKQYDYSQGIWGSPWAGWYNFKLLFAGDFLRVFKNTLVISFYRLLFGFPFPIIIALLLNEITSMKFKRAIQTTVYLPHFISWVILGGILYNLLAVDSGVVNLIIRKLGFNAVPFFNSPNIFVHTIVFSMIWKEFGWATIIYLAALTGVDMQLYEAATIDGANRWQQTLHVTIPSIMSTIVVILILRLGNIMEAGFEQIFVLYHPGVYSVADIIDTFVYRMGITNGEFGLATAAGLFKSLINLPMLVCANMVARKYTGTGIY
jgi:putative aldouronate transport system permease protein